MPESTGVVFWLVLEMMVLVTREKNLLRQVPLRVRWHCHPVAGVGGPIRITVPALNRDFLLSWGKISAL